MNMDTNIMNFEGRSFSVTLAQVRLGRIDALETVFTVDLDNDLIVTDHGDVDVMAHESQASIHIDNYGSAGELADVITEDMENWGSASVATVWFAGDRVYYSHRDAVDPWIERKGGTGENN